MSKPGVWHGEGPCASLNKKIERRKSPMQGYGLFATETIVQGELVWQEREDSSDFHIFTREEVEKADWSEETRNLFYNFSYQVGEDKLSGPITMEEVEKDYAHFQNHCCDPNTWFADGDADAIIARRDIQPGEEITYDYATSETEARFGFEKCRCNAGPLCRGKVTSRDWQLPELQERYGRHFAPFIVEMIQHNKKE